MLFYGMFWFTLMLMIIPSTLQVESGYIGRTKDYYNNDDDNWKMNRPALGTDNSRENVRSLSHSTHNQDLHLPIRPQQSDDFTFKIQRDSDGKLNLVFNNSFSQTKTTNDNLALTTNPVRRSTTTITRPPVTVTTTQSYHRRHEQGDDVEKDVRRRQHQQQQHQKIAPKCSKSIENFCVEVENYPIAHVQEALISADLNKYASLFGDDVIITTPTYISERIDGGGEESLCHGVEKLIYPQAGLTKDNNWSFIVNQDNYTQGIRIEECANAGKPCAMSDLFPNGYTTECRQNYIHRQLLAINSEGKIAKDLFRLPSCCKCIIKSSHRFKRNSILKKN